MFYWYKNTLRYGLRRSLRKFTKQSKMEKSIVRRTNVYWNEKLKFYIDDCKSELAYRGTVGTLVKVVPSGRCVN